MCQTVYNIDTKPTLSAIFRGRPWGVSHLPPETSPPMYGSSMDSREFRYFWTLQMAACYIDSDLWIFLGNNTSYICLYTSVCVIFDPEWHLGYVYEHRSCRQRVHCVFHGCVFVMGEYIRKCSLCMTHALHINITGTVTKLVGINNFSTVSTPDVPEHNGFILAWRQTTCLYSV